MASKPLFELEDQTGEDFFDRFVEEDDYDGVGVGTTIGVELADSDDSAHTKAFANLSLNEIGKELDDSKEIRETCGDVSVEETGIQQSVQGADKAGVLVSTSTVSAGDGIMSDGGLLESEFKSVTPCGNTRICDTVDLSIQQTDKLSMGTTQLKEVDKLVSKECPLSDSFSFRNEVDSIETARDYQLSSGLSSSKSDDLSCSGIKEVNWSSFSNAAVHDSNGFGSYSDFFTDLGVAQVDNIDSGTDEVFNNEAGKNALLQDYSHAGYEAGNGTSVVQTVTETGSDSNQNLEHLYPGWKFDPVSGQWYQVDGYGAISSEQKNSNAAMGNVQGSFNSTAENYWTSANGNLSGCYYAQQSLQPVSGTVSQMPQGSIEYPAHMVFDSQYPGWYYDTNAQEWYSLERFNSNQYSVVQTHQQLQNDSTSLSAFSNVNNQAIRNQNKQNMLESYVETNQQNSYEWQPAVFNDKAAGRSGGHSGESSSTYDGRMENHTSQQNGSSILGLSASFKASSQVHDAAKRFSPAQYTVPGWSPIHSLNLPLEKEKNASAHFSVDTSQNSMYVSQQLGGARSSEFRPPHALVTFGFGGKLVVMKDNSGTSLFHGTQDAQGQGIFIFNLMEVVSTKHSAAGTNEGTCSYFDALCQQSLPGPLVGGSVGGKELNKWIDDRISKSNLTGIARQEEETLKLLLSLLKIACQHYGKLRSLGKESGIRESDVPEAAVAKLFASARGDAWQFGSYSAFRKCLTNWPTEAQVQATASEIQNLLVNGRKMEALQCAQEGHCWDFALILAHELGDQFYASTLKQMALSRLVAGTPLRTLCLLIAKSPEEVFVSNATESGVVPSRVQVFAQPAQFAGTMLDNWAENLAVITANRTENDHLVITHLGDCLWKEKSDIIAAHTCYLVAEAEFESYSNNARLCLIGADHWNFPRTYASPEAIQRTELLEYSNIVGNSQFIFLPFQPYKILYAHMLAEVGKVSDSLKYCQAVYKCLKTARSPEVDAWKQIISSLEERIKSHQRGGYSVNLAPAKIVGKLLKVIDSTAQRAVGPPPVALTTQSTGYGFDQQTVRPALVSSQSTMSIPTITPSASMEPVSQWALINERMTAQNRSISEPVMTEKPTQDQVVSSNESAAPKAEAKVSNSTNTSRFGRFRFGTQLLQKTVGLLRPRQGHQAKLGDENKFYYDEKLKRWVEAGVDPPTEEPALPPPPPTALSNASDYTFKNSLRNGGNESIKSPVNSSTSSESSSGIPSMPPSLNKFSSRSRMGGVRSRYVDNFNKGSGSPANFFPKPSELPIKPASSTSAKFFVPAPPASSSMELSVSDSGDQEVTSESKHTPFVPTEDPFQKLSRLPSTTLPRFPSVDNIPNNKINATENANGSIASLPRRTTSWSGGGRSNTSPQPLRMINVISNV
ncbi:hypothetical protein V2J09_003400 [Rumex salicifolius]